MGSGKAQKPPKASTRNPSSNGKLLGPNKSITKPTKKKKLSKNQHTRTQCENPKGNVVSPLSASQQLRYFLNQFEFANGVQLSSLELESINESCILELSQGSNENVRTLEKQLKGAFGASWKAALCEGKLLEGKIDSGSPSVLFISMSALRSIDLLRTVRSLTEECHAAKLFSKHMKVQEQVSLLKNRVNIASGTPSRIKKLIDIEALKLSHLAVIVLDLHTDLKGYSLLTLPQVRDEFWDLYKNYFHQRLVDGDLRLCLYGPIPIGTDGFKGKKQVPKE